MLHQVNVEPESTDCRAGVLRKSIPVILMVSLLLCLGQRLESSQVRAQNQDTYRVETTDGNVFTGTVVLENEEFVVLRTDMHGEITIRRANIRSMTAIDRDRLRDGVYWFENPQATRYFFAPNAIGIRSGSGYYQNAWIFFNNVNYGLTDNFSIGGGTIPLFLLGVAQSPVWVLPKISVPIYQERIHLAAGAMLGGVLGEGSFGIVYGLSTLGNRDRNLTIGVAYGYAGAEWADTPVLNVSGMTRLSRRTYLISENYFSPGTDFTGIISGGVRWASENLAVDLGLVRPLEETGGFIGLPWLGVTIPFGR